MSSDEPLTRAVLEKASPEALEILAVHVSDMLARDVALTQVQLEGRHEFAVPPPPQNPLNTNNPAMPDKFALFVNGRGECVLRDLKQIAEALVSDVACVAYKGDDAG